MWIGPIGRPESRTEAMVGEKVKLRTSMKAGRKLKAARAALRYGWERRS